MKKHENETARYVFKKQVLRLAGRGRFADPLGAPRRPLAGATPASGRGLFFFPSKQSKVVRLAARGGRVRSLFIFLVDEKALYEKKSRKVVGA